MNSSALRRTIHASTAVLVLLGELAGWDLLRLWLSGLAVAATAIETLRLRVESFASLLASAVPAFRPEESRRPSGAFWLLIGYAGASWVPVPGPAAGILAAALADPVAAVAGGRWGGGARKSLIGTGAVLVVCAVVFVALGLSPQAVVAGAIAAAALERWSGPLDDNLVLAPGTAATVWLLS